MVLRGYSWALHSGISLDSFHFTLGGARDGYGQGKRPTCSTLSPAQGLETN